MFDAAVRWPLELAQRVMRIQWLQVLARLATGKTGQDVVDSGLLIATIALVVLIVIVPLGAQIEPWFAQVAGRITPAGT
jgi:Flp pilus assembly pilin Flp